MTKLTKHFDIFMFNYVLVLSEESGPWRLIQRRYSDVVFLCEQSDISRETLMKIKTRNK